MLVVVIDCQTGPISTHQSRAKERLRGNGSIIPRHPRAKECLRGFNAIIPL